MAGDPHIKNKPFYLAVRVNLLICARSPIFYTWKNGIILFKPFYQINNLNHFTKINNLNHFTK